MPADIYILHIDCRRLGEKQVVVGNTSLLIVKIGLNGRSQAENRNGWLANVTRSVSMTTLPEASSEKHNGDRFNWYLLVERVEPWANSLC